MAITDDPERAQPGAQCGREPGQCAHQSRQRHVRQRQHGCWHAPLEPRSTAGAGAVRSRVQLARASDREHRVAQDHRCGAVQLGECAALRDGPHVEAHALVERREPPHGLGRTVRDAINLKLFPVYPNPPAVNDWDVPVALLDLQSRVDGNWDLTLRRILPFIDGVHHVKRIAQLADADLGLTRACLEHLVYYGCIVVVDIFQYFNMYTVRPAHRQDGRRRGAGSRVRHLCHQAGLSDAVVSRAAQALLACSVQVRTLHDWIEDNDLDDKGIDVRRFVSFGSDPRLPAPRASVSDLPRRALECRWRALRHVGGVDGTQLARVVTSPMAKPGDSGIRADTPGRRDQSGSREPRDRRPRELSGMMRAEQLWHVADQTAQPRASSQLSPSDDDGDGRGGGGVPDARQRPGICRGWIGEPTLASQARQCYRPEHTPSPECSGAGGSGIVSTGASGIAGASGTHPHPQAAVVIPSELVDMLDGLHSDDELCTAFSISWPELEKMLVQIGVARHAHERMSDGDTDDDDMASHQRSDWRRWPGAAGSMFAGAGASSGWSKPGCPGSAAWSMLVARI
ncbi:hypothetical protein L1887_56501 [Cichorium endivia]|nr:hypothetical protein L1887_56501 [Cichorium endivia]